MARALPLVETVRDHLLAESALDLGDLVNDKRCLIAWPDPRKAQTKPVLFLAIVSDPVTRIDDGLKRRIARLAVVYVVTVDPAAATGDVQQLDVAYAPVHARLELLEPNQLTGARSFKEANDGQDTLGCEGADHVIAAASYWDIEYDRAIGTTD